MLSGCHVLTTFAFRSQEERASWEWQEQLPAQRLQDEADKKRKEEEKERQRQEERDKRQRQQREKRELQKQRGLQEKEAKTGAAPPPPVQLPAAAKTPGAAPEVKKRYSMDYSRFNQLDDSDEEDQVPAPKQAGGPPIDLAIKRTTERTASPLPPAAAGAEEKKEREQERLKKERREEAKKGVKELRQRAAAQCKLRHLVCPHAECRVLLSHLPEFCASPSSCPACRGPLSRAMFARCRREDELSSALQRALGSDGLRVLLPANAEAILDGVLQQGDSRLHGKGRADLASSCILRHMIQSSRLSEDLLRRLVPESLRLLLLDASLKVFGDHAPADFETVRREILRLTFAEKQTSSVERVPNRAAPPGKLVLLGDLKTQVRVSGVYFLVPEREAAGHPIWRHWCQDACIARHATGKWLIQAEKSIGTLTSYVRVVDSSDSYPHVTSEQWMEWECINAENKGWVPKPSLKVFADPVFPRKFALYGELKLQWQCVGTYSLVPERQANGWPVWKHESQDRFLTKWPCHGWMVQREDKLGTNSAFVRVDRDGLYPHTTSEEWREWECIGDKKGWIAAPCLRCFVDLPPGEIAFSLEEDGDLRTTGRRRVGGEGREGEGRGGDGKSLYLGTYSLVPDRLVHGFPVWRRTGEGFPLCIAKMARDTWGLQATEQVGVSSQCVVRLIDADAIFPHRSSVAWEELAGADAWTDVSGLKCVAVDGDTDGDTSACFQKASSETLSGRHMVKARRKVGAPSNRESLSQAHEPGAKSAAGSLKMDADEHSVPSKEGLAWLAWKDTTVKPQLETLDSLMIFLHWMEAEGTSLLLRTHFSQLRAAPDAKTRPQLHRAISGSTTVARDLIVAAFIRVYLIPKSSESSPKVETKAVMVSGVASGKDDLLNGKYFPVAGQTTGGSPVYKKERADVWIEKLSGSEWTFRGTNACFMTTVYPTPGAKTPDEVTCGWEVHNADTGRWEKQKRCSMMAMEDNTGSKYMICRLIEAIICGISEWTPIQLVEETIDMLRQLDPKNFLHEFDFPDLTLLSTNFSRHRRRNAKDFFCEWNVLGMAIESNIPQLVSHVVSSLPFGDGQCVVMRDTAQNISYPPLHLACMQRVSADKCATRDLPLANSDRRAGTCSVCELAGFSFALDLVVGLNIKHPPNSFGLNVDEPCLYVELIEAAALDDAMALSVELKLALFDSALSTANPCHLTNKVVTFSTSNYIHGPLFLGEFVDMNKLRSTHEMKVTLRLLDDAGSDLLNYSSAFHRQCEIIQMLMLKGASIEAANGAGQTPLVLALDQEQPLELVRMLLSRVDKSKICAMVNAQIERMEHVRGFNKSEIKQIKEFQMQLNRIRGLSRSVLAFFNEQGRMPTMDFNLRALLLKTGVHCDSVISDLAPCISESSLRNLLSLCAKDTDFTTILPGLLQKTSHTQLDLSDLPVMVHVEKANLATLALLLENRASPNNPGDRGPCPKGQKGGLTPLHAAVKQGTNFVKILIDARANCNIPGGAEDNTPLHDACRLPDEATSAAIVGLMLQGGRIDLTVKNKRKKTAAEISKHSKVKNMLLEYAKKQKASSKKASSSPLKKIAAKGGASSAQGIAEGGASSAQGVAEETQPALAQKAAVGASQPAHSRAPPSPGAGAAPTEVSELDQRLSQMRTLLEQAAPSGLAPDADMPSTQVAEQNIARGWPFDAPATLSSARSPDAAPRSVRIDAGVAEAASAAGSIERTPVPEQVAAVGGGPARSVIEALPGAVAAGAQQRVDGVEENLVLTVRQMILSGDSWELRFTREFKDQVLSSASSTLPPLPPSSSCFCHHLMHSLTRATIGLK